MNQDTPTDTLSRPWEDVTIVLTYRDGKEIATHKVHANRAEIEGEEGSFLVKEAYDAFGPDSEQAERARSFTLSPAEFQHRIMEHVSGMLRSPLTLTGKEPHAFRMLPATAILGLVVEVNNLKSSIIVPGRA